MKGPLGCALGLLLFVGASCDGRVDFDSAPARGGAGAGGGAQSGSSAQGGRGSETCPRGLHYAPNRALCVECIEDADCPELKLRRCIKDGELANRCVDCEVDADCDDDQRCVLATHTCATICDRDDDVRCDPVKEECALHGGYCAACTDDDECWRVAFGYHCGPGGARCVQCLSDADCSNKPGPLCDPVLFLCVDCRDSRDCRNREACHPETHTCI